MDTTSTQPAEWQSSVYDENETGSRGVIATDDRRRSSRVPQRLPAWISGDSVDRGSRGSQVTVGDLSMHGVGFTDRRTRYRIGAAHWIVVSGGSMRVSSRVRIVSCRENAQGGWDVGAAFF